MSINTKSMFEAIKQSLSSNNKNEGNGNALYKEIMKFSAVTPIKFVWFLIQTHQRKPSFTITITDGILMLQASMLQLFVQLLSEILVRLMPIT